MNRNNDADSVWTQEEIAQVLKTADLLRHKSKKQRLNIRDFCEEIGLSRKNAYKHKRHYETEIAEIKQQLAQIKEEHNRDIEKNRLLEQRLAEAERKEKLIDLMRALIQDYQKKSPS